jgi:CelD/BcsL family acetyltransferase involved in cellulose biosynthesis
MLMLHRPTASELVRAEIISRDEMLKSRGAWQRLADNSVEDNVYYAPIYAGALLQTVESKTNVSFAAVWRDSELVALLPFVSSAPFPSLLIPWTAWQSEYTYSCTPLLHRNWRLLAAENLVTLLTSANPGEWTFPRMNIKGPVCQAIIAALDRTQRPWTIAKPFARAVLDVSGTFAEHLEDRIPAKRRRDLARNRRRLEKLGVVAFETHCLGPELSAAVDAFLQIEGRGWKGRRGSALACHAATREFALKAFSPASSHTHCRADVLKVNGQPIAVGLTLFSGQTGFTVKCAYDEQYATYSPGLLLELEFLRSVLQEKWATRIDSGTDGAHVIDGLWPGRTEVADLVFSAATSLRGARFSAFLAGESAKRAAVDMAKSVVNRFRVQ